MFIFNISDKSGIQIYYNPNLGLSYPIQSPNQLSPFKRTALMKDQVVLSSFVVERNQQASMNVERRLFREASCICVFPLSPVDLL